jgi:tetratricopeptide (TPR) repeat protein
MSKIRKVNPGRGAASSGEADALVEKGVAALRGEAFEDAVRYFRSALKVAPLRRDIRELLAMALDHSSIAEVEEGQEGEERLAVEEVKAPKHPSRITIRTGVWLFVFGFLCLSVMAFFVFYSEHIKEFIQKFTWAKEAVNPIEKQVNVLYNTAQIYLNQNRYQEAIATLEKALDLNPPNRKVIEDMLAQVYSAQGESYYRAKNYEKAVESYEKAVSYNDNITEYYYSMGWAQYMIGRDNQIKGRPYLKYYREAIKAFTNAVKIDSGHVRSYSALARVYVRMNNPEEAAKNYRKVIEIDPDSPEAQRARQQLESMLGKSV